MVDNALLGDLVSGFGTGVGYGLAIGFVAYFAGYAFSIAVHAIKTLTH